MPQHRPSSLMKMLTILFRARMARRSSPFAQAGIVQGGVAASEGRTSFQTSSFWIGRVIHSRPSLSRMASWPIGVRLGLFRFATGPIHCFLLMGQFFNKDVSALDDPLADSLPLALNEWLTLLPSIALWRCFRNLAIQSWLRPAAICLHTTRKNS